MLLAVWGDSKFIKVILMPVRYLYLLNVCKSAICKTEYLQFQLIEEVAAREEEDNDKILWKKEKCLQRQLFTLKYGLDSVNK